MQTFLIAFVLVHGVVIAAMVVHRARHTAALGAPPTASGGLAAQDEQAGLPPGRTFEDYVQAGLEDLGAMLDRARRRHGG